MATFAKTFDVDISSGRPAASNEAYYHGETIEFRAVRGKSAVTNISYACIFYQTNGMDQTWWKTDGLVFHPTNDIGAASYRFFLEGRDDLGRDWHANGLLRLLDSPGFTPSAVELPVKTLDFASIAVHNAPFYTKPETDERIVALAPAPGNYAAVSNAAMKVASKRDKGDLAVYEYAPWTVMGGYFDGHTFIWDSESNLWRDSQSGEALYYTAGYWLVASAEVEAPEDALSIDLGTEGVFTRDSIFAPVSPDDTLAKKSDLAAAAAAATNYTDEAIASVDIPEPDLTGYATHAQATNAARAVSAPLEENVGVLWQFVFADSVWLAVTNYMRTVEGVVPSLQLWEVRDGATNLVYHSTEEVSNVVDSAIAALRAAIMNAMPDKAWSRYQSATGAENPQPTDITIISTPKVMLTGGGEWNRYVNTGGSAIWVLHVKGNNIIGGGTNGSFFRVEDDEGNAQFEVSRTDSYEVDAVPESCGWDEGGNGNGNFQVTFNAPASGNQPVLYATTNLVEAFVAEENGKINSLGVTVNWGSSGGLWRATIVQDTNAPVLFVHAKVLQEGSIVIHNNAPTTLDGGLFINNTKYRVVPATISGKTVLTLEVAP